MATLYEAYLTHNTALADDHAPERLELTVVVNDEEYTLFLSDTEDTNYAAWHKVAQLWIGAPDLLAACEAEEAIIDHRKGCFKCWGGGEFCDIRAQLAGHAMDLRRAAIAKALDNRNRTT